MLSLLKLDHPGLEKVKAAEQAKRYDVAERERLAYFKRTRSAETNAVKALAPRADSMQMTPCDTLTLDNRDTRCQPTCLLWSETTNLVALVVENQSFAGLKHRRTVLFVDNRAFLIHDEAIGGDAGSVRVHFQFAPCKAEMRGLVARTCYDAGANLLAKTFALGKEVALEQEEGWISYTIDRPAR